MQRLLLWQKKKNKRIAEVIKEEPFMKIALGSQMREMDRITTEEYGIPSIVLMENASTAVAEKCMEYLEKNHKRKALLVCGGGNNGGDGFAAARLLKVHGYDSKIFFCGKKEKLKGDALINYNAAVNIEIPVETDNKKLSELIEETDLVVDAVFGTGFSGEPREESAFVINKINEGNKYVISVDIASGVDSETGHISNVCVKADETVSFCMAKVGNILYPGAEKCGKLTVADISIPQQVKDTMDIKTEALDFAMAKELVPKRKPRSNKGTYGKLYVFAGSFSMGGAAVLCSKAAYKSGCGLVYSCVPEECLSTIQMLVPEAVAKPLKSFEGKLGKESFCAIENELDVPDCAAIGPGMGKGGETKEFLKLLLPRLKCKAVIDADALNNISDNPEILRNMAQMPVITPHPGEMSRLTGKTVKEVLNDTIGTAKEFAKEYNTVVLLKDARTIIASPDGRVYINMTGNNAMSKGGSGDVLTGIIGALLAVMENPFEAAALGAYIHGLSGEKASEKLGHYGVLAGDICSCIADIFKLME